MTYQMLNATLVNLEFDGTVSPGLAESYEFNDDFTTFTAHLRKAAKFSDGSPITAADVAATFTRHIGVKDSTIGSTLNRVASVVADGDDTVVFTFPAPFPSFVSALSQGALGVVPAASLEDADAYYTAPEVTSGQYTIDAGWASNRLELTANEDYWGPQPIVKDLTLTVIEDANSAISQLQSGQIDFAGDLAPNFITQIEGTDGIDVLMSDVFGFFDVRLNNRSGPFSDVNMRKAVNAAIDREEIVSSIWGDNNSPQSGFWPDSMEGHVDRDVKQDLPAAKKFLADTDCADGCSVRMMYSDQDFPFSGQLALMVQSQLAEVGIEVQLEKLDASTMIDRLFAGEYDMVPGAMASSGNVPDPLLANALLGTGFLKAEFTGYNSDEMNGLIQTVNVNDGDPRTKAIKQIEEQFVKDQPYVTLAPWVRGSASTLPKGVFALVGATAKMGSVD
ncbi:ABC transporter substrate-binding protein [Naasia aerilata]|uniref:ABC transporter substrate-binding protein n=1 Tax=Naasia aerilata TaxID=1162966 RepID=UPI00257439BD|nr:ABC transporter substrate-binding protein [Naasia aerilata]